MFHRRLRTRALGAERLLYRIGLGSRAVVDTSFDLECARFGEAARSLEMQPPLFVCGLARAGTTILTRTLYESNAFASSTYRDLPFPLAPNVWRQLSRSFRRADVRAERGHGDGMIHDLDSPEAIEEVFWRHFCGSAYIKDTHLVPHEPSKEVLKKYTQFMRLVALAYGQSRYLAKNNNTLLRLPALLDAYKGAVAIIPFRSPVAQAASLLHQHKRAIGVHQSDPFRGKFMQWLGHYEFGSNHRPFVFESGAAPLDASGIDHWVDLWTKAYQHLSKMAARYAGRMILVDYDQLCRDAASLRRLCDKVGCPDDHITEQTLTVQAERSLPSPQRDILIRAETLHSELQNLTLGQ